MAELEAKAQAAGATAMALHVFTGNAGAIEFYESIGYNRAGRAENFYAQNQTQSSTASGLRDNSRPGLLVVLCKAGVGLKDGAVLHPNAAGGQSL